MSSPTSPKLKALSFSNHHAYFLQGEKKLALNILEKSLLKEFDFKTTANPDYTYLEVDNFTIEDGKMLKEIYGGRPFGNNGRIFVISFKTILPEAQNSLLKILEEPNSSSRFFLISPNKNVLLSTLKSRVEIINIGGEVDFLQKEIFSPKKFLDSSVSIRFKMIKEIVSLLSSEEIEKSDVSLFIKNISEEIKDRIKKEGSKENQEKLSIVLASLLYSHDRSSSVKMLLEHLAIVL